MWMHTIAVFNGKFVPDDPDYKLISSEVKNRHIVRWLSAFVRRFLDHYLEDYELVGWIVGNDGRIYAVVVDGFAHDISIAEVYPNRDWLDEVSKYPYPESLALFKHHLGDDVEYFDRWNYDLATLEIGRHVADKVKRLEARLAGGNKRLLGVLGGRRGRYYALIAETAGKPGSYKTAFHIVKVYGEAEEGRKRGARAQAET